MYSTVSRLALHALNSVTACLNVLLRMAFVDNVNCLNLNPNPNLTCTPNALLRMAFVDNVNCLTCTLMHYCAWLKSIPVVMIALLIR